MITYQNSFPPTKAIQCVAQEQIVLEAAADCAAPVAGIVAQVAVVPAAMIVAEDVMVPAKVGVLLLAVALVGVTDVRVAVLPPVEWIVTIRAGMAVAAVVSLFQTD